MASFRSLTADRRPFHEFRTKSRNSAESRKEKSYGVVNLHVFEWLDSAVQGKELGGIQSIEALEAQSKGAVRVIFAPPDNPTGNYGENLLEFLEEWGIPSAFVDEGLQGVSQSFAAREDVDGTTFVWFHFLCKTLAIVDKKIVHLSGEEEDTSGLGMRQKAQSQAQANFSWIKPGFVLKIREQNATTPKAARTSSSGSDGTLSPTTASPVVELFCFGVPASFQSRFRALIDMAKCEDLIRDPYALLEVAFEEMYKVLDWTGWNLGDIFGKMETEALEMARNPGRATKDLLKEHFTGLHNLAKHTIYLRENCEAALATLQGLYDHHESVSGKKPNFHQKFTRQALDYRKTLFESTQRRLTSLDARISNIIQLSFNVVTQGDSKVMQSENQSMKTIAVTTLLFMPLGTVASIFGSQFMQLQEEYPHHITVSQDFWLMWVIAVPLTFIVVVVWRVWYVDAREHLVDGMEKEEGKGYLGWRSLFRRIRRKNAPAKIAP
ncbi:hypothetical protein COCCADRAFT_106345 [Bipolaris zeicola 26-R-13]|uniref:Uncharacterized protein n=1 Tax=Cochliobolus carbonum (strain 26-R-13) TaxID=930089 RepID=W6YE94_COCC2|nr:uncharacterized protein COCCADRAFT_106345 [Bipolaris zeicola 26-R-13]EUC29506.1 hypothetical protein COCCADRAFT_106345 [Bipolaris zeicola 26-R-13]